MLEWVAISFSRAFSQPRNWTRVSCIADSLLTELRGKPYFKKWIKETKILKEAMCLEKDPHIYFRSWENEIEIRTHVLNFFFFFWPCSMACRILVPQRRIKPMPPALEMQSLNHWTAREVPRSCLFWRGSHQFLPWVSHSCTLFPFP